MPTVAVNTYCSLGQQLIRGNFADTYLQEAGLVFTRGSVVLSGVFRPDVGQVVEFAWVDGQIGARLPRKLRVLSSFANPRSSITTVQLGCLLTYLEGKREPEQVTPEDSDPSLPPGYEEYVTPPVEARTVAERCLIGLGISPAQTIPLTNRFTVDAIDLSEGYVEVLDRLLVSENFVGYLNELEQLVVRSLDEDNFQTGPIINNDNILSLGPIGVGELPGEAVTVSYSTLELIPGTSLEPFVTPRLSDTAGWTRSYTTGFPVPWSIQYTEVDGSDANVEGSYVPTTETITTFSNGRPTNSRAVSTKPYFAAAGNYASQALSNGVSVPGDTVGTLTETDTTYDNQGRVSTQTVTKSISTVEFIGRLPLDYFFSDSDFVVVPAEGVIPAERAITTYEYNQASTKKTTQRFVNWALDQPGQQAINEGRASFTTSSQVSGYINQIFNSLEYTSTEVQVNEGVPADSVAPSQAGFAIINYARGGQRTEQVANIEYIYGSTMAQRTVNFTLPFSGDDYFAEFSGIYRPVSTSSEVKAKAVNYGRVQNRIRLGNRDGLSLQIPVDVMPPRPFDPLYVQLEGLTGQYRVNGASWTFDNSGIVCTVDALFWGGIGS